MGFGLSVALSFNSLFGDDASKAAGTEALPGKCAPLLAALERALARSSTVFFSSSAQASLADLAVYDSITSPFPGLTALGMDLTAYPKLVACANAVGQMAADSNNTTNLIYSPVSYTPSC
jgi:hypothetical protein